MGYVIAGVLVVLIIAGLILSSSPIDEEEQRLGRGDPGADQNPLGIVGSDDDTPAGDTDQHADTATGKRRASAHEDRPTSRDRSWAAKPRANGPRADILDA